MAYNTLAYILVKKIIERLWVFLFARKIFEGFNNVLLRLVHKSLGINNYQSHSISGETFWIDYVLKTYDLHIVFDIGAHIGEYTDILRSAGYKNTIYLFEPHPDTFLKLQEKQGGVEGNLIFNIGFSASAGEALIFDYDTEDSAEQGSVHASLYKEVMTDIHKSTNIRERRVILKTLDDFVKEEKIERISLLKIDTEGNEYSILLGARRLIQEGRIDIIQFEFGEMNVISRVFFKDFYDFLSPFYHIYRLLPNSLLPIREYSARYSEIFSYQNIVCLRKS
jgi:FkbM family methyltransferase